MEALIGVSNHATIDALLDTFHRAAAAADLALYFGCFHKTGRFLGTDASENWSAVEFLAYTQPHFVKGEGWTYTVTAGSRKVTTYCSDDGTATFATFDELLLNSSFGTCRGSGTLVFNKEKLTWLIAAYHLTFPVPNDLAHDITKQLMSADSGHKQRQADQAAAELLAELDMEDSDKGKPKSTKKKKGSK